MKNAKVTWEIQKRFWLVVFAVCFVVAGCDNMSVDEVASEPDAAEIFTTRQYLISVQQEVAQPLLERMKRIPMEELHEIRKFQNRIGDLVKRAEKGDQAAIAQLQAEQKDIKEVALRFLPEAEQKRLQELAERWMKSRPELESMNESEIRKTLEAAARSTANATLFDDKACESACAATAVLTIAAIEATWVGAMLGCAGATFGYPLCAGLATTAKYAAVGAVGTSLVSCTNGCD